MRHRPRRQFAAPLIAVAGCSSGTPRDSTADFDSIDRVGTACVHTVVMRCRKNATCNPPPPRPIECPPAMGDAPAGRIGMVQVAAGAPEQCVLIVPPCNEASCGKPTPCLHSSAWAPLRALAWSVEPAEDGSCRAIAASRTDQEPAEPLSIACPPALAAKRGFITRPTPVAPCVACAATPCDTNAPNVPCPPDPAR